LKDILNSELLEWKGPDRIDLWQFTAVSNRDS